MPKVTEAHTEARRQQILDAAAACFGREGFHRTTMHDICAEAALSPGALYRYFASKEEIIEAMVAERRRQGFARIEAALALTNTTDILDRLAGAFDDIEDVAGCAVDVELWGEAFRNDRIHRALGQDLEDVRTVFTGVIRDAQARGDITATVASDAVAQVMLALFHGMIIQRSLKPDIDVAAYVQAMKAMLMGRFWTGPLEGDA